VHTKLGEYGMEENVIRKKKVGGRIRDERYEGGRE